MCRRVTCRTCGKATYAGCGQHVEQVLRGVPDSDRCACKSKAASAGDSGRKSTLGRLFGR